MGRPQMQAEVQRLQEIADITGMQARTGMPAAAMEAAQQNIERQQQASLAAATSLGGGMRSISGIGDTTAQQYRALNVQDVAAQQASQQQYLGALGALAGAEGRAEAYNVLTPYEQMAAEQQALEGASIQNIMGGYQTAYDTAAMRRQQNIELVGGGLQAVSSIAGVIAQNPEILKR
jgi:cytochrome c1